MTDYMISQTCIGGNGNNMNFKITDMKIKIKIPKGFMNTAVTTNNFFIADTNDSANWDTLKFPLPKGKWSILSVSNEKVILHKV